MQSRTGLVILAIAATALTAAAQNVTSITQSGNKVSITLSADIVELSAYTDCMVGFEYKSGGKSGRLNEYLDPKLTPKGSFTSVQTISDPATISGPNYTVKIGKSPFSIEFLSASGTSLFKTNSSGLRSNGVGGSVVSGDYYGLHNGPSLHLTTLDSNMLIDGLAAGEQGWGRSPLVWTPAGLGIYSNQSGVTVQNGTLTISGGDGSGNFHLFLIAGTPRQVMNGYFVASAPNPLPPKYVMAFMNSEWKLTESELKTIIGNYRSKKIPIDMYILDYDWWKEGSVPGAYCWDAANFPSAQSGGLKRWMDSCGVKMMGIRKPWFTANGTTTWIGFQDTATQNSYWRNFISEPCNPYARGIIAYWNDEADAGPQNLGMQKGQYLGQRAMNNLRVMSLNRCYQGGAHRYAYAAWSGDIQSTWTAFSNQRKHMLSSINLGLAWWAQDIGGFHPGDQSSQLYIRWMQMGAFTPIYRVHGSQYQQRQPWAYGDSSEKICRELINLRYRLLPYTNNSYHRLTKEGLPVVRPLVMDYPSDPKTANYVGAWMFGDDILAAPVSVSGATTKTLYLPNGTWYEFWTGNQQSGGSTITVPAPLDKVPAYVKAGAIIPMGKLKQYSWQSVDDTIEIRVYPGANGQMTLYEEDDSTYAYESGAESRIPLTWNDASGVLTIGARTGSFPGMLTSRVFNVVFVSASHGVGAAITAPDQKALYTGSALTVTRTGVGVSAPIHNAASGILTAVAVNGGIRMSFTAPASYTLTIHSLSGRAVRRVNGPAGVGSLLVKGNEIPAGIYVAALSAGNLNRSVVFSSR